VKKVETVLLIVPAMCYYVFYNSHTSLREVFRRGKDCELGVVQREVESFEIDVSDCEMYP
jgi:hypothetical protein